MMKIWVVSISLCMIQYTIAVTPQSMRIRKDQTLTKTAEKPFIRKRSTAKKAREQQLAAMLPTERYNTNLLEQKEARKQYKEIKRQSMPFLPIEDAPSITMSEMNYTQLCQRKNELILMGDYDTAIRYLERMLRTIERSDQVVYIMLELGELFMKSGNYRKAERMYIDFVKLYPNNQFFEQAYLKGSDASYMQTLAPDRDQTKTEATLALIEEFLAHGATYSADSIAHMLSLKEKCHTKIAESNLLIAKHYIGRGQHGAAHKRLDEVTATLANVMHIEPQLLETKIELALAEGKQDTAHQLQTDLQQRYPQHEVTLALLNKPTWKRLLGI